MLSSVDIESLEGFESVAAVKIFLRSSTPPSLSLPSLDDGWFHRLNYVDMLSVSAGEVCFFEEPAIKSSHTAKYPKTLCEELGIPCGR